MIRHDEKGTDYGFIKIHKNVIAQVACIAAKEVEGISRISTNLLARGVNLLTKGKIKIYPVKIELKQNNEVSISISIVVHYGVNIPTVALNVQENIKKAIEKMTGLYPTDINIKVKGVDLK